MSPTRMPRNLRMPGIGRRTPSPRCASCGLASSAPFCAQNTLSCGAFSPTPMLCGALVDSATMEHGRRTREIQRHPTPGLSSAEVARPPWANRPTRTGGAEHPHRTGARATRNPRQKSVRNGSSQSRMAERQRPASSHQPPPRYTWLEPVVGPLGSVAPPEG